MKDRWGLLCLGFILAVGVSGCLKGTEQDPQIYAGVAIYHSSPDSPDVNIIIDSEVINSVPFKYKNYSNYIEVLDGGRRFRFNKSTDGSNLIDATLNFEEGKSYTLFIVNTLSKIELLRIEDITDFPASGNGKIRCLQLSPDAPQVEIRWQGESTPLFGGLTFKQLKDFIEVPASKKSVEVKVIGGSGQIVILPDVDIQEGKNYTILVEGFDKPPAFINGLTARVIAN
jgi:hypothetical protein